MTKHLKTAALCFGLAIPLLCGSVSVAQQKKKTDGAAAPAPIPAQILSAKKIFIANGGGDESRYEGASYSGGPDRAYNEFHAAMKSWGRYELVGTPGEADLVFEIRVKVFQLQSGRVLAEDNPMVDSQFRMVIRDAKSHETLWGLTEHAERAMLQSNRDKNFELALAAVVTEVKRIAGPDAAAAKD